MTSRITAIDMVSLGVSGAPTLPPSAIHAIQQADTILGADHHFDAIHGINTRAQALPYASPFSKVEAQVRGLQGNVVILASGDGLFFGIGQWITRHFSALQPTFHPNVSSIQAACHLIGKPWQTLQVITAHGRPLNSLRSKLTNHCLFGLFTDKHSHPHAVAALLVDCGFSESTLWVCEAIGTEQQKVTQHTASTLVNAAPIDVAPLHVIIIETAGEQPTLPEFPGIPDTAFSTDGDAQGTGLLTKREVRINILSLLQPTANDIAWDIGAGCGGVAIEWARWNPRGDVYAIEYHEKRMPHLQENCRRFGVEDNLHIVEGRAPEALPSLPAPNKIFVGGSGGALGEILECSWKQLLPQGTLVIACVTENNKARTLDFLDQLPQSQHSAQITQISVSRGDTIANQRILRPQLPVVLVAITKAHCPS